MRTIPIACAALFFATVGAASSSVHAENEAADGAPSECVVYSEVSHRENRTLDVNLANTCSKAMACTVGWTVTCGKASNVTRAGAMLGGSAQKTWIASAESCTEDWAIDTTWSCKPTK
jgi:hypothetical protein